MSVALYVDYFASVQTSNRGIGVLELEV